MSKKMGRPTDDPKNKGYRLRLSDSDWEKLEYCTKHFGKTKAEVLRQGIEILYNHARTYGKK